MRKDQDRNFWSEFFKWFLFWEFIGLIFKGIIYVCKLIWLAFKQLVWLICIGIKKITPIIKEKISKIYTKYKPIIAMKFLQFRDSANVLKDKLKEFLIRFTNRHKDKKKTKNKTGKLFNDFKIKKVKYSFLNFYYNYELSILIGVIMVIIITIFIIFQSK